MLKNIKNGKIYIGQTSMKFRRRMKKHLRELEQNIHSNQHLQNVWNQNKSVLIFGIIEECDNIQQLNQREKYWIQYYDSCNPKRGYNKTFGGRNWKYSKETIEKMRKIKAKDVGLSISQYNKNGDWVATYCSIREAARQTGAHEFSIRRVLNPNLPNCKTAGGYQWSL